MTMHTCFACRAPISSSQSCEGEGRCRSCDNDDLYEEDIFIETVKVDCCWIEGGGHMMTFQAMTSTTQIRLREWLEANIAEGKYDLDKEGESVLFAEQEDFDLAYIAFA